MDKCVCIFGPTASGKTSLAIELANIFNGVIISCDSMQIYKELEIGTAKPTAAERSLADFRLIDFMPLESSFSVYDYKKQCENEIEKVLAEKKLPIICGGTGLYFDAILNNTDFGEFETDEKIHNDLISRSENPELLLNELKGIDGETAENLHPKDIKKIIRALEVYYSTGKTLTQFKKESHRIPPKYDFFNLFLTYSPREALYDRINKRVDLMLESGLVEETRNLYNKGLFNSKTASQAIGYKEILTYIKGEESLENAVLLLKQHTRNYAKRQITWFKRYDSQNVLMNGEIPPLGYSKNIIEEFINNEV